MTWDPPEPGTHFGKAGEHSIFVTAMMTATAYHDSAAREYRLWRRGFWLGFEQGFDAAYKYVDPEV